MQPIPPLLLVEHASCKALVEVSRRQRLCLVLLPPVCRDVLAGHKEGGFGTRHACPWSRLSPCYTGAGGEDEIKQCSMKNFGLLDSQRRNFHIQRLHNSLDGQTVREKEKPFWSMNCECVGGVIKKYPWLELLQLWSKYPWLELEPPQCVLSFHSGPWYLTKLHVLHPHFFFNYISLSFWKLQNIFQYVNLLVKDKVSTGWMCTSNYQESPNYVLPSPTCHYPLNGKNFVK